MKTMTCAQMGGMCDEKIKGSTPDEMITCGMAHLEAKHPEMAQTIKSLSKDDPMLISWNSKFLKDFHSTPHDAL